MNAILKFLAELIARQLNQQVVHTHDIATASADDIGSATAQDTMLLSAKGIELISNFEGFRAAAYQCSANVWTIGYGTTVYPNGIKVKNTDRCDRAQAQGYMQHDLKRFEQAVNAVVTVALSQNQFDALLSLTYNIGINAFKQSTLLKKLNEGDYLAAAQQFEVWNRANGQVVAGLVNRRKIERSMFEQ